MQGFPFEGTIRVPPIWKRLGTDLSLQQSKAGFQRLQFLINRFGAHGGKISEMESICKPLWLEFDSRSQSLEHGIGGRSVGAGQRVADGAGLEMAEAEGVRLIVHQ